MRSENLTDVAVSIAAFSTPRVVGTDVSEKISGFIFTAVQ
jgi:hypothetical protein